MTVYESLAVMLLFGTYTAGILSVTVAIIALLHRNNIKK